MSALLQVQAALPTVSLNKDNPFFKSKYADLAEVRSVVMPLLTAAGVVVVQRVGVMDGTNVLETIMTHVATDDSISSQYPLPPLADSQKFGAAVTYARRYALVCMTGVVAEDDLDGNDTLTKAPANGGGQSSSAFGTGLRNNSADGGVFL